MLAFIVQNIVFASTYAELHIPEAGIINTHDLDTLKKFETEKQIEQDFKKFQDTEEVKQGTRKTKCEQL